MAPDRAAFWWRVAERFGVPCTILVFAGMIVWCGGSWVGAEIAKPLINKHIEFLETTSEAIKLLRDGQDQVAKGQEQIAKSQEASREALFGAQKALIQNLESLDAISHVLINRTDKPEAKKGDTQ